MQGHSSPQLSICSSSSRTNPVSAPPSLSSCRGPPCSAHLSALALQILCAGRKLKALPKCLVSSPYKLCVILLQPLLTKSVETIFEIADDVANWIEQIIDGVDNAQHDVEQDFTENTIARLCSQCDHRHELKNSTKSSQIYMKRR